MLYTDKGFSFEAELTQSVIFASRGSKPEEFHHQILIVKVPENSDMLDGIKEAKSIKQESQDEYETISMTYRLDGFYQEIKKTVLLIFGSGLTVRTMKRGQMWIKSKSWICV